MIAAFGFADAAEAAVGPCTAVQIIGLRGAGEKPVAAQHGMGAVAGPVADAIASAAHGTATVSYHGLPYAASATAPTTSLSRSYFAAKDSGAAMLHSYLAEEVAACPATKHVIVGYSQGAHAAADQLAREPASITDHVAAVILFGDPRFNPSSSYDRGTFNPRDHGLAGARSSSDFSSWSDRVFSFCNRGDLICQDVGPGHRAELHDPSLYVRYAQLAAKLARHPLGLPAPPSPRTQLDLAFVVDSTGSMEPSIDGVSAIADSIMQSLVSKGTDFRVGLVDFKDTDQGDAYASRVDLPMTADASAFGSSMRQLVVGGGGDGAEAVFSGVQAAVSDLSWRPIPRKVIILMGDSPPKDPEPVTGFTRNSTVAAAQELGATIYPVAVGSAPASAFEPLATRTGGQLFEASPPSEVADQIAAAVDKASTPVFARLVAGSPARPGTPVLFSAAGSFSEIRDIVSYAWDFDGDGTTDATTPTPRAAHVYAAPFAGTASVTVTTDDGSEGSATADVDVRSDAPLAPGAPQNLHTISSGSPPVLKVRWAQPADLGGGKLAGYHVEISQAGSVVGEWATDSRTPRIDVADLPLGRYRIVVTAADEVGTGAAAVVAGVVSNPPTVPPRKPRTPARTKRTTPAPRPLTLTALTVAPGRFRAARSGPSIARRASKLGAIVSYALSDDATVTFRVDRILAGRLKKGRCRRLTRATRHAKRRCRIYKQLPAALTHSGQKGTNRFRFSGRLGGRRLKPGRYRLRAVAVGKSAGTATAQPVRFRILRRHRTRASHAG